MTKRLVFLLCMLVLPARAAFAQDACPAKAVIVAEGEAIERPAVAPGATTVSLRTRAGVPIPGATSFPVAATWTTTLIAQLQAAAAGAPVVQMLWSQDGKSCFQTVSLPPPGTISLGATPPPTTDTTGAVGGNTNTGRRGTPAYTERDCGKAGSEWLSEISRQRTELDIKRITVLVFRGESGLCFQNNERPTQGDPIYVGVFTAEPEVWTGTADFQPCSMEPSAPSILITDRLTVAARQSKEWYLLDYLPRRCWNPTVSLTVSGTGRRVNYTLAQATRYRATLHLGTVFSETHDVTFGLRPESPTVNRIFSQGPTEKGPDYVASLVFYSILRYLPPLGGRPSYPGRDPVRDNAFADKLGAVIGVGLRDPRERFNVGFAFEIAAGVNILGVWDYAQTNILSGVKEGDVFTGSVEQIPVTKEWQRKFVMGVSLDLVYATTALRR
jgi:hypothetical protein